MRWLRSWPRGGPPTDRSFVWDDMERLYIGDYDYTPLKDIDEDVALIEWDMAISLEDRQAFEQSALVTPSHVLVAPYRLYEGRGKPVWAHRRVLGHDRERWVMTGESHCELFGFGLIYLPRALVRAFLAAEAPERGRWPTVHPDAYTDARFTDQTFSTWHYWRSHHQKHHEDAGRVRIAWHVTPVHLHYVTEASHVELPVPVLSGQTHRGSGL